MNAETEKPGGTTESGPLEDFSNCHVGIIDHFERLRRLPQLLSEGQEGQVSEQAREVASTMQRFFKEVVIKHHAEEEEELFTAVTQSAEPGAEADKVAALIKRLVDEHRTLEGLWKQLERSIKRLAKGKMASLDEAIVEELSQTYVAHARFEEQEFLPLSSKILSKNDQSALGLSLHMRHLKKTVPGYI